MREYARIRGVNLNAVQTAIKSGRIHKTIDDKIDVDEANRTRCLRRKVAFV